MPQWMKRPKRASVHQLASFQPSRVVQPAGDQFITMFLAHGASDHPRRLAPDLGVNPTERVPLGRTGLEVTRLGLGTAPLGGMYEAASDEQGRAVVDAAWAAGLR